jgi:hypothetical protein
MSFWKSFESTERQLWIFLHQNRPYMRKSSQKKLDKVIKMWKEIDKILSGMIN